MKDVEKSVHQTADIAGCLAAELPLLYSGAKIIRSETSTGSELITLDLGGRDRFNITITRARR